MQEGQTTGNNPQQPEATWQYQPDAQPGASVPQASIPEEEIRWTASEFIEHSKSAGWYLLLAVGGLALAAVVFILTKDKISTGIIIVVAIIFGVFAARKPRELQYAVDTSGVHVGDKFFPYASFKSFSVVQEDGVESIWLMPLKRFMPILTIYFAPNDADQIVAVLSGYLPFENRQMDIVDRIMHRLRF